MNFKGLQAATGIGGPKLAQEAGPVGAGAVAEPMGDERTKWEEEQKRKQQGYKKGGKIASASSRADGIAIKGKTRGKMY